MEFQIKNLSIGQADCFLVIIENSKGDICTILIDGNKQGEKNESFEIMKNTILEIGKLDYIIITHIDNDHLGGILSLINCKDKMNKLSKEKSEAGQEVIADKLSEKLKYTKIIYNCVSKGEISYSQAKELEELIDSKKIISSCQKTYEYDNENNMLKLLTLSKRRIVNYVGEKINTNVYFTFLNPDKNGVNKVSCDYNKKTLENKKADAELVNRNSIAFLLEFANKHVVFTGDTYWGDIETNLNELKKLDKIDLIKIPHHGAENNSSGFPKWAKEKQCNNFIVTGPEVWDKLHPSENLINELEERISAEQLKIYTKIDLSKSYQHKEDINLI